MAPRPPKKNAATPVKRALLLFSDASSPRYNLFARNLQTRLFSRARRQTDAPAAVKNRKTDKTFPTSLFFLFYLTQTAHFH